MLSTRNHDQENLAHTHQVAGAAKANALGPKTPGPQNGKTPARRIALNDENTIYRAGKSKAIGKEAFQTPAPRERAPLGAKTTNAKARSFATPAGPLTGAKPAQNVQQFKTPAQQRASSRKKLRIHHSPQQPLQDEDPLGVSQHPQVNDAALETAEDSDDDSVASIEYCPPPIVELPDYPDPDNPYEIKPDDELPMLKPENLFRGSWEMYYNPIGEDGLRKFEREEKKWEEENDKFFAEEERKLTERSRIGFDKLDLDRVHRDLADFTMLKQEKISKPQFKTSSHTFDRKPPSTTISRSAAAALSSARTAPVNRFAAPTAASQARQGGTAAVDKTAAGNNLSNARVRGKVGAGPSNTTIGRAKGRQVSAELRGNKPTMAERMRPSVGNSKAEAQKRSAEETFDDRSARLIEQMIQNHQEEERKLQGVRGGVDELGLEALDEALHSSLDDDLNDFRLELPADDEE